MVYGSWFEVLALELRALISGMRVQGSGNDGPNFFRRGEVRGRSSQAYQSASCRRGSITGALEFEGAVWQVNIWVESRGYEG